MNRADDPRHPGTTVYLNGKFTAQKTTGVQRVASRLVQALDEHVSGSWVLLCPPGVVLPALRRIEVRTVGWAGLPLALWEQAVLPIAARDGRLVNLAGAAPAFARRQVCMLHDAAVFDHPEAYTGVFVVWYRWLFRRLARRAERLITVSAFARRRLALRLGVPESGIGILRNGGDHLDALAPDPRVLLRHGLDSSRYLLTVASENPTKNLGALMAAFARLPAEPGLRLVLVGDGNRRVFSASTPGDPPGVLRTGRVTDAELKSLYLNAVAMVFPSVYEGFGLPLVEAMACGCPIAASKAAAMPEVCADAALYFDPASIDSIEQALRQVLGDRALRERLRLLGRARAAEFRWSASAEALSAMVAGGIGA